MPTTPSRNSPCPCGSGRKYKLCCLREVEVLDGEWRRLREAEGRALPPVWTEAYDRYDKRLLQASWCVFHDETEFPDPVPLGPEDDTIFLPWMALDFDRSWVARRRDRQGLPERPLVVDHLERHQDALDPLERAYLEAASASPFTFLAVRSVTPGRSLALHDILTGQDYVVLDRNASTTAAPGAILFAKVVTIGRVSILVGVAPYQIPPNWHNAIIEWRERAARTQGSLTPQTLRSLSANVVAFYRQIVRELLDPTPPRLQNTDGDPIEFTTVEFDLHTSVAEAFDRLKHLAVIDDEEGLLSDAGRGPDGSLESVTVPWTVRGNRMHAEWDNTSLGQIEIGLGVLTLEVNSARRAKKGRQLIERRLGRGVTFRRQTTESLEEGFRKARMSEDPAAAAEQRALMQNPEVQAQLREMAARRWEAWLDQPVPALGGVTPREAAKAPLGREKLEALLAEFEWRGETADPANRVDVAELRRRLGL